MALAKPQSNENAKHGHCTAYFNGSDRGRDMKRTHGQAFIAFEEAAEAAAPQNNDQDPDNDIEGQEAVELYCGVGTEDSLVGGNPDFSDPGTYDDGSGPKK